MKTYMQTLLRTPLADRWEIEYVATHKAGSVLLRVAMFGCAAIKFVYYAASTKPKLVHLHAGKRGSFARKAILLWISKLLRLPVVMHIHAGEFEEFYGRTPSVWRWVVRMTLAQADVVVALGEHWAQRLRIIAPYASIVAIPNAINTAGRGRKDQGDDGDINFVHLGRICDAKGTFVLLRAWSKLVAGLPTARVHLTIAGSGELHRATQEIRQLGIASSVSLERWLPPARVAELLTHSDVLVLASRREGQPMSILEAMAHGLCVVASPVGGIPELLDYGRCGILVPPDEVEELTFALRRVVTDDELRRGLGNQARTRTHLYYDADKLWRSFDSIYCDLAQIHQWRPDPSRGGASV